MKVHEFTKLENKLGLKLETLAIDWIGSNLKARSSHERSAPKAIRIYRLILSANGVIDSLLATQHALTMFRRTLPNHPACRSLDRLSNRLSKILAELRNLNPPSK